MFRADGFRPDPLHIFAVSAAAFVAAVLFLIAMLNDISFGTAVVRIVVSWVVLALVGIALAQLVRWILMVPAPTRRAPQLDVTLPSTDRDSASA
jgi:hypothetical protein